MSILKSLTWDNYFLNLCYTISEKSKDPSTKVGSVIVYPDHGICSTGFNGFPRGVEDSEEKYNDRPLKYKMVVHAEANAILNAAFHGHKTEGCTLYVPWHPCSECTKKIIQSGIKEVVMDPDYQMDADLRERWKEDREIASMMFEEAKVLVRVGDKNNKEINFPKTDEDEIKKWFNKENQLHRDNGPAVIYSNGRKEYWENGKQVKINKEK